MSVGLHAESHCIVSYCYLYKFHFVFVLVCVHVFILAIFLQGLTDLFIPYNGRISTEKTKKEKTEK